MVAFNPYGCVIACRIPHADRNGNGIRIIDHGRRFAFVTRIVIRLIASVLASVFGGTLFVIEPRVELSQVVMRSEVFGVNPQRILELLDSPAQ